MLANGLAYAALFAVVPISLLVLGLAGFVTSDPRFQADLVAQLRFLFPPLAGILDEVVRTVGKTAGFSSILGVVGLIWAVSQFYVTLDSVFARIFNESPQRGFAGRELRGLIWVVAVAALVVLALVVTSVSALIDALLPTRIPIAGIIVAVLGSPVVLALSAIVVVALAYRVLPPRPPAWRAISLPAVVASIVAVGLAQGFSLLAPRLLGSATVAVSLATAFAALAWLSFTFQVLLLGAAWVRIRVDRSV
jgi:uncharacterized BrkB/YihY/UPF0761 family membrane protein